MSSISNKERNRYLYGQKIYQNLCKFLLTIFYQMKNDIDQDTTAVILLPIAINMGSG